MVYYPLSLHLQETYNALGYKEGGLPESERARSEVLSPPLHPELSQEQIREVVEEVREFIKNSKKQPASRYV